jgi:hypothetical protein
MHGMYHRFAYMSAKKCTVYGFFKDFFAHVFNMVFIFKKANHPTPVFMTQS